MRLARLAVTNFRRIRDATFDFAPTTFIIGQNNIGKSSVIRAIELLLSERSPEPGDFHSSQDGTANTIVLVGEFTGIDSATAQSPGFKGRVVNGTFCYRRTYDFGEKKKPRVSCIQYRYALRPMYSECRTHQDLIDLGVDPKRVTEVAPEKGGSPDFSAKLKPNWERELLDLVVDFDETSTDWFDNPGGIPQRVQSKLPTVVMVPSLTEQQQIGQADAQGRTLIAQVLHLLFEDLLKSSPVARDLESQLRSLEEEMRRPGSVLDQLSLDVNKIIGNVFPDCGLRVNASLNAMTDVVKPKYDVTMFSNTTTDVSRQGTGLLRATLFSMLRHHAHMKKERQTEGRPLLFAFEEPELFLHPSAGNLLRDTVYALGETDQIVCTTHSPWMIDLTRDQQSLTKMSIAVNGDVTATCYGISEKAKALEDDDRVRVDLMQLFDDELSRVFFCEEAIIVEGDSEVIAIRQALRLLPEDTLRRLTARVQVVNARGKTTIPALIRYLTALSIPVAVMHDRDYQRRAAATINADIEAALIATDRLVVLEECLEDVLGYRPPATDKPFRAYQQTRKWSSWESIPAAWRHALVRLFRLNIKVDFEPTPTRRIPQQMSLLLQVK